MMAQPNFWDDQAKAQEIIDQNNALKAIVTTYHDINNEIGDMKATFELLQEDDDEELKMNWNHSLKAMVQQLTALSFNFYLMVNMMQIMRFWSYIQVLVVQNRRTGQICCSECTSAFVNNKGLK